MKKNVLALSIAAMVGGLGFAGAVAAQTASTNATELRLSESGTGHILLVPYFTTQNDNMSVLHVVNTDQVNGKAVKVRFRGAANSDDVLDFQVFLSPGDVWTAAISKDAAGRSSLTTGDNSCTLPRIPKAGVSFVTDRLNGSPEERNRNTREGYIELFNMADIKPGSNLFREVKHVNGVPPCLDAGQRTALNSTLVTGKETAGLAAPTTGLTGSWYIINVPQTTTYSGAANVIRAVDNLGNPAAGVNVFSPQDNNPIANAAALTADPLLKSGLVVASNFDIPDLSTPYLAATTTPEQQVNSLTEALAVTSVINQFANDSAIKAKTDWVFSMPTRRYSIAANYKAAVSQIKGTIAQATASPSTVYSVYNSGTNTYFSANAGANTSVAMGSEYEATRQIGQICLTAPNLKFYDREEGTRVNGKEPVFSPGEQQQVAKLCGEVSVLKFADRGQSVLGADLTPFYVEGVAVNGWGQIGFGGAVPVVGAAFLKVNNPNVGQGVSGNYGITWPHAYVAPVKEAPVTPNLPVAAK